MISTPRKLPLRTGAGWREVEPRTTEWRIAWEGSSRIFLSDTNFKNPLDAGSAGGVDSPLAYNESLNRLFRYYCPALGNRDRENGILGIDPVSGKREMQCQLHPLRMVPWMLQTVPEKSLLVGLVVTDASQNDRPGIVLQHQIGLFHLAQNKSLLRQLPDGCLHPVASSPQSDRLLFHGPDGFQLVNLKGHRKLLLSDPAWGDGRSGAAFHPANHTFVIGGPSLTLYNPATRDRTTIAKGGCFPVWTQDGDTLFHALDSASLSAANCKDGENYDIVSIPGNRHPERKKARPVELSPDQRFFALPLTRRAPYHAKTVVQDQPAWTEHQTLIIGDLEKRELWQYPGPIHQCAWVGRSM